MSKKMEGLREILLRKTQHDEYLHTLIKHMDGEILAEYAIESLEKMAQKKDFLGRKGNHILHHFGANMESDLEGDMLHDALSHHASNWKKATKSGNEDAARGHAKRFVELMNFAHRVEPHSNGKLKVDSVDLKPWEQNHHHKIKEGATGKARKDYTTEAKGWHTRATNNAHDFMRQPPHWSYKHSDPRLYNKHKDSPYPVEEVKINGKHLHIDDSDEYKGSFDENMHEFDHHPAVPHANTAAHQVDEAAKLKYIEGHSAWDSSEHVNKWLDRHDQLAQNDPNYAKRGLEKPEGMKAHALSRIHADPFEHEAVAAPVSEQESPKQETAKPTAAPAKPATPAGGDDHVMWNDTKVHAGNAMEHLPNMLGDSKWLAENHQHLPKISSWATGKKGK